MESGVFKPPWSISPSGTPFCEPARRESKVAGPLTRGAKYHRARIKSRIACNVIEPAQPFAASGVHQSHSMGELGGSAPTTGGGCSGGLAIGTRTPVEGFDCARDELTAIASLDLLRLIPWS